MNPTITYTVRALANNAARCLREAKNIENHHHHPDATERAAAYHARGMALAYTLAARELAWNIKHPRVIGHAIKHRADRGRRPHRSPAATPRAMPSANDDKFVAPSVWAASPSTRTDRPALSDVAPSARRLPDTSCHGQAGHRMDSRGPSGEVWDVIEAHPVSQ